MAEKASGSSQKAWESLFATSRLFDPETENRPFLKDLVGTTISDDEEDDSDDESLYSSGAPDPKWNRLDHERGERDQQPELESNIRSSSTDGMDVIHGFLHKLRADDHLPYYDAEQIFNTFCSKAARQDGCIGFIDDRNISRLQCGKFDRQLGVDEFCEALKRNRWSGECEGTKTTRAAGKDERIGSLCAHRRLILVENPNGQAVKALLSTASKRESAILTEWMCKYINFEPSIGVQRRVRTGYADSVAVSDPGRTRVLVPLLISHIKGFWKDFVLNFHIPCYVLKSSLSEHQEKELLLHPSRHCFRLPCSPIPGETQIPDSKDYLCEVQTSMAVFGMDMERWAAYAFKDTYHRDSFIENYPVDDSDVLRIDPIAGRSLCLENPIPGPIDYFFGVVQELLKKSDAEWDLAVRVITGLVKKTKPHYLLAICADKRSDGGRRHVERFHQWIIDMGEITAELLAKVEDIAVAGESFRESRLQLGDCGSAATANEFSLTLRNIDESFRHIAALSKKLARVERELKEGCRQALSGYLALESNDMARLGRIVACITVVSIPIALTSSLFSIQAGVLPVVMNATSFFGSLLIFTALVIISFVVGSHWNLVYGLWAYVSHIFHRDRLTGLLQNQKTEIRRASHDGHIVEMNLAGTTSYKRRRRNPSRFPRGRRQMAIDEETVEIDSMV